MNDRDLRAGVPVAELQEKVPLFGKVGDDAVMLVRTSEGVRAFSATCTHYSGPLAEGLLSEDVIRCPWHHACFSLRTGEAVAAPALNPLTGFEVEIRDGLVHVGERIEADPLKPQGSKAPGPDSVVIVGAGAAGSAAAEMLRREGYSGPITLIDPDAAAPYDRPNLSKDYLSGHAPEEWLPLRPEGFYEAHGIKRVVAGVTTIDVAQQRVVISTGESMHYGALLLATGSSPIKPPIPGNDLHHVHVLRSLDDCRAIIRNVEQGGRVVVAGASFIGMEVAASLRQRGVDVTIIAPEAVPFARVLGADLGSHLRALHEEKGVQFRLGHTVKEIRQDAVVLDDDSVLSCDVVILGIGVRPLLSLAEAAGVQCDNGVVVNEFLESSAQNVYAAGDIARVPDPRTNTSYRVEHWVVAQRQGQTAARNMLGLRQRYDYVPFFWTQQYDVPVAYVGHAVDWDVAEVKGSIASNDCSIVYRKGDETLAVATIGRDMESLRAEVSMEKTR